MAKGLISFRLGKNDGDIDTRLEGVAERSEVVKHLIRLGMAVEAGEYVKEADYAEVMGQLEYEMEREEIMTALEASEVPHQTVIEWKLPEPEPRKVMGKPGKPLVYVNRMKKAN